MTIDLSTARALPLVPELVRAVLDGRKTVTRRPLRPQPRDGVTESGVVAVARFNLGKGPLRCPYGAPGSILWIRERARVIATDGERVRLRYEADGAESGWIPWPSRLASPPVGRCIPNGVHREGARIFVEVTDVRVERVQEITEEDARREGFTRENVPPLLHAADPKRIWPIARDDRELFSLAWTALYGAGAWERNDWVWRIAFRRVDRSEIEAPARAQEGARAS